MRPKRWRRRWWVAALLVCLCGALPATALGTRFHKLADSTIAFASDGLRYAAWQSTKGSPITVLDTSTGRRKTITVPAGCDLQVAGEAHGEPSPTAANGRFLLVCAQEQRLLDVRTATSAALPSGPTGTDWQLVGARYLQGSAARSTCHQTRRERDFCVAVYEIATGAVSDRPQSQAPDLDRPGAPVICRRLRAIVGPATLSSREATFGYSRGLLARPAGRGDVRIDGCRGRHAVLHDVGEPENLDIRGGILTCDTGHPGEEFDAEFEGGPDIKHGVLSMYRPSTGERRGWTLPRLPLAEAHPVTGVLGYSTHTANTVFWIAARTLNGKLPEVETSAVYALTIWAAVRAT